MSAWDKFDARVKEAIAECWPDLTVDQQRELYNLIEQGFDWMANDISSFLKHRPEVKRGPSSPEAVGCA